MTGDDFREIFKRISGEGPSGKARTPQTFRVGNTIRIISGPFGSFTGKIEGINKAKSLLLVKVEIFERPQPVKIKFIDAENISE